MSLRKRYLKTRPVGKVTFRLPAQAAPAARQVSLVGEFNDWDATATPMKRLRNGEFTVTVDLETGRSYQFRYLVENEHWTNDGEADGYRPSGFPEAENSVVDV